jgi:hypothetical protein
VILSRKKRFAVLGYLTLMLILLNTLMFVISNVMLNNSRVKKRSLDGLEELDLQVILAIIFSIRIIFGIIFGILIDL